MSFTTEVYKNKICSNACSSNLFYHMKKMRKFDIKKVHLNIAINNISIVYAYFDDYNSTDMKFFCFSH